MYVYLDLISFQLQIQRKTKCILNVACKTTTPYAHYHTNIPTHEETVGQHQHKMRAGEVKVWVYRHMTIKVSN